MQKNLKEQSRLWDYTINHKLGKGQYGQVFQVINKTNGKIYALKKMHLSGSHQKQKIQAFKQIKSLKLISHPSIIQYKESFLSMDNIYIVMEYASKGDLYKVIQQRKRKEKFYSEGELWKMFEIIIKGVKHLHEKNIIHRDLKLENLFVTEKDQIKIGDLGMSKILSKDDQLISTRVGTPIYFAPQLIRNQLYSFPIDIWSIGCIFYYLTMLQHPFQEANMQTLAYYIIDKDPKPIKGQYSIQLINFINSCLVKDAKLRPTIFELAIMLKNKNQLQTQRNNNISIFNLKQLTKLLNSQALQASKSGNQIQKKGKKLNKITKSVIIPSPRIIPKSSLSSRRNFYCRNLRSSVQPCYPSLNNKISQINPQSPISHSSSSKVKLKPRVHLSMHRPPLLNTKNMVCSKEDQLNNSSVSLSSPMIKSNGFSMQLINSVSPEKTKITQPLFLDFVEQCPEKILSYKRNNNRKSFRP